MTLLGLVVVRVDLGAKLHLLDDHVGLVPPCLAGLLGVLVLELPVVHELADRRACRAGRPRPGRGRPPARAAVRRRCGTMPTFSPLGPTRRTSGTRIRSLMRSSVLMCPPVVMCPEDSRSTPGNRRRLPLVCKRKPVATVSPRESHHRGTASHARRRGRASGPDPTTCAAAVDAGGRRDAAGLRLRICPPCGTAELIGQRTNASRSFRPAAESRRCRLPDPGQASSRRRAPCRSSPSTTNVHRPGDVDHQRVGAVLERRAGRERGRDRHRPGLRVPARSGRCR